MKHDYFPKEISSNIYNINLVKGGALYLKVQSTFKDDEITIRNSNFVLNHIKKGVFITKLINSNKCYIIKGDSIMYFNCYVFSKDDSLQIGKVRNWNDSIINHWILRK